MSTCSVLSIHHKSKYIIPYPYFINGHQLTNSSSDKLMLGYIDTRLTFNLHINRPNPERAGVFSVDFHHAILPKLEKH